MTRFIIAIEDINNALKFSRRTSSTEAKDDTTVASQVAFCEDEWELPPTVAPAFCGGNLPPEAECEHRHTDPTD